MRRGGDFYFYFSFSQSLHEVLNPQMIVDVDVAEASGPSVRMPLPEPVLQRLVSDKTLGIALRPLGTIVATFYAAEASEGGATLSFSTKSLP